MTKVPSDRKRAWKKLVGDRAREILNRATIGQPIAGDAESFLRDLVTLHPEAEDKIGCGIDRFEVRQNEWKGRTFWLVRLDGTETDFSFLKCLTPPTAEQDFAHACRCCVVDQILAFKNAIFDRSPSIECPVTGEALTRQTAHIDHAPPNTFRELVARFAAQIPDIRAAVKPTADGDLRTTFADPSVAARFSEFHRANATLRAVSRRANLSVLRTQAI